MKRILFVIVVFIASCGNPTKQEVEQIKIQPELTQAQQDSIQAITYGIAIKKELEKYNQSFDNTEYRGNAENLQKEISNFSFWAAIIEANENSLNEDTKKSAIELKNKMVALQIKEFPKLRKEYTEIMKEKLWENDITVNISGYNNDIIMFTGVVFAANKNKKETQESLQASFERFRFKEARYRWSKVSDEYTSWKMENPKDNQLIR